MTIDGFSEEHKDAFVAFAPTAAHDFYAVIDRVARTLKVQCEGVSHLPKGRVLLVANHAFGWDIVFAMNAIWQTTGRPVWALGEHAWWSFPYLRKLAASVGTVDGTRENVDRLLSRDEIVLVLPGGLREALKPRELRYRLLWGNRFGFARGAIRNQAPVVTLASIGADDVFDLVGNAYRRGERLLRRTGIPIPLPSHLLPIPHLVKLRYVFGEPIAPPAADLSEDPATLRRFRHEIGGALHELIDQELAKRAGISI